MPGLLKFNLDHINKIFESNIDTNFDAINNELQKLLSNPSNLKEIGSLNTIPINCLKSGDLVHFRCMVQDMLDPEIFLGKYQIINIDTNQISFKNGMFHDIIHQEPNEEIDLNSSSNVNMERQVVCCTLVPYENSWVNEIFSLDYLEFQHHDDAIYSNLSKRKMDLADQMEQDGETDAKKFKLNDDISMSADNATTINKVVEKMVAVIVKIYENNLDIKLNQILEVYGILSHNNTQISTSCIDTVGLEMDWEKNCEMKEPIIHAIFIKKLECLCPFPTLSLDDSFVIKMSLIREELISIFDKLLFGDKLATEYLLCNLLSSVYLRKDVSILGKFSLNLSEFLNVNNYIDQFYEILSSFVTKSHLFKMTLSNMNEVSLNPRKDYDINRLVTSMLQLSSGTYLVLDETALTPGTLNTNGINNVRSLNQVLVWQKLDYDFSFFQHSFETDIPILIISEGRSLLKPDCHVPLVKCNSNFNPNLIIKGVKDYISKQLLNEIRAYFVTARMLKCDISSDTQKLIEDDFVEMRKNENITPDNLHLLIVFARLLATSYGLQELNCDIWRTAKKFEIERRERIKTMMS